MEEEIDLRPYIDILIRSWYWILLAGLVAGGTAYLVSKLSPETYEAEAAVATIRERTNVSFNTSIQTQEEDLGGQNADSRLDGLVALATSSDVATQVLAEIGSELDEESQTVPALIKMITASGVGDLIIITATYTDPELTSRIANIWAQVYEDRINDIYASEPNANQTTLASQVISAENEYEVAKADSETFIANNRITFLQNEIASQSNLLASYQSARNKLENPVDFQVNTRQAVLSNFYTDLSDIEVWMADAQSLRDQVAAGEGSTPAEISNALAFIALRSRITGGSNQEVTLQFDLENTSIEAITTDDIDAVIEALETRQVTTLEQIEAFSSLSFSSADSQELEIGDEHFINQRIIELNNNLLALEAELSSQTTEQLELNQAQSLAWETYQTLTRKQKETEIASTSTGTEVRIASNSTVPDEPTNTSSLMLAILGAIVGMMVAIGILFTINWWSGSESVNNHPSNPTISEP